MYKAFSHAFEFYADGEPYWLYNKEDAQKFAATHKPRILYTAEEDADSLMHAGLKIKVLENFEYYRISMLTGRFLDPATRSETTKTMVLLQVTAE